MELVFLFFAPVFGVFVGTFLVARVGSWIEAIVAALRERRGDSAWAVPAVALLHSGPWLLGLTLYWAYYVLAAPHSPAWPWFFGGIAAAPVLWAPVLIYLRRAQWREAARKKAEHTP